jgi:tetrahydromethanopterin S-methyltransferase subunit C
MRIQVDLSALGQTKWHDYAVRFLFGGLITALAGIIAKKFGPGIGGLFLAFPAIFPASATLIEKHEKKKKASLGLKGEGRGRSAASIEAAGSSMGSIGLFVFALAVSQFMSRGHAWIVLGGAMALWLGVSVTVWHLRRAL